MSEIVTFSYSWNHQDKIGKSNLLFDNLTPSLTLVVTTFQSWVVVPFFILSISKIDSFSVARLR